MPAAGDGDDDVVIANVAADDISILRNVTIDDRKPCAADVDGDGVVDWSDLDAMLTCVTTAGAGQGYAFGCPGVIHPALGEALACRRRRLR